MNLQPQTLNSTSTTNQQIFLTNTDNSLNHQNIIFTQPTSINLQPQQQTTSTGFYLIQPQQQQQTHQTNTFQIANPVQIKQQFIQQPQAQIQPQNNTQQIILQQANSNNIKYITTTNGTNNNQNSQNIQTITSNLHSNQLTNSPRIIIQQHPQQSQQQTQSQNIIITQQPTNMQTTNHHQIISNSNVSNSTTQNSNQTGQIFLNINNRIVPIQSVNIKPATIQTSVNQQQPQPQQQQQQQQQLTQQPQQTNQILIIPNSNTNSVITANNTSNINKQNLGADISEKMKQLEQIQAKLKLYQQKILNQTSTNSTNTQTSSLQQQTVLTQAQIQSCLTSDEQSQLQLLLVQKKTVEAEIQQLKQKLITTTATTTSSSTATSIQIQSPQTQATSQLNSKIQLLQQVTQKLNTLRSSKTATIDSITGQQQLVLTHEEFDQMKKLIDLQNQLQNEIKQISSGNENLNINLKQVVQQQQQLQQQSSQPQPQITTTIKLNELSLAEKNKLNEIIKNQIEQLKQTLFKQPSDLNPTQQQQIKDKYIMLVKKQSEMQSLIDKEVKELQKPISPKPQQIIITNQQPTQQILNVNTTPTSLPIKQTPIKIRNVIAASSQNITVLKPQLTTSSTIQTTPLRTLVINNKDNMTLTPSTTNSQITLVNTSNQQLQQSTITLAQAVNIHKQYFSHVQFKCLNFEELAQNSIITKETDDLTINLLKQLDERASQVINREQLESFTKNQVKLVKKYLEQQQLAKTTIKNRINEQLLKDQKLATEPDFKTPFTDKTDAIKRLSRYHVFQKTYYEPSEQEASKFDECFEDVSERLLKIADAMKKRFNLLQLRSMQKEVVSSEETMLLKLYVDDLKQNIEQEKKLLKEKQEHKPTISINLTDSPKTISKLIQLKNNDMIINTASSTSLKRALKLENDIDQDECNNSTKLNSKILKLEPTSDSNTSLNSSLNIQQPTSSSSSSFTILTKKEPNSSNQNLIYSNEDPITNLNSNLNDDDFLLDYDNQSTNQSLDDSNNINNNLKNQTNSFINEQFELYNGNTDADINRNNLTGIATHSLLNDNDENSSSGINQFTDLDDLILNEDELAVQGILDF